MRKIHGAYLAGPIANHEEDRLNPILLFLLGPAVAQLHKAERKTILRAQVRSGVDQAANFIYAIVVRVRREVAAYFYSVSVIRQKSLARPVGDNTVRLEYFGCIDWEQGTTDCRDSEGAVVSHDLVGRYGTFRGRGYRVALARQRSLVATHVSNEATDQTQFQAEKSGDLVHRQRSKPLGRLDDVSLDKPEIQELSLGYRIDNFSNGKRHLHGFDR